MSEYKPGNSDDRAVKIVFKICDTVFYVALLWMLATIAKAYFGH